MTGLLKLTAALLLGCILSGCDALVPPVIQGVERLPFIGVDPFAKPHRSEPVPLFDPAASQPTTQPAIVHPVTPYNIAYNDPIRYRRLWLIRPDLIQFPLFIEVVV